MAWFWQERPDGFAIIDHYANNGEGADHYIAMLKDKKYDYERIWLPHDARAKTFATKKSAVEQFMEAKLPVSITPRLSVEDGIEAARQVLPQCRFDYERCYEGVEALRVYRKQWNEMHQVFSDKPLHDFASDHADAFRYLAIVARPKLSTAMKVARATANADTPKSTYTLDALFRDREAAKSRGIAKLRI